MINILLFTNGLLEIGVGLVVVIVIFLLFRSINLWYWKIDVRVKNQEEIIRLLKKIANEEG